MADLFSCWEQGLPQMHELVPLSQALLPFDLATAFDLHAVCDVDVAANRREGDHARTMGRVGIPSTSPRVQQATNTSQPSDRLGKRPVSLGQDDNREGSGEDMTVRAMKRPRLVWTPKLHKRFVEAVETMGVDKAVPKTVMQMMDVSGLTRENVASHLQKYRLLLKKQDQERQTDKHSGIPEEYPPVGEDVGQQVSNSKQLEGNNQCTPEAG